MDAGDEVQGVAAELSVGDVEVAGVLQLAGREVSEGIVGRSLRRRSSTYALSGSKRSAPTVWATAKPSTCMMSTADSGASRFWLFEARRSPRASVEISRLTPVAASMSASLSSRPISSRSPATSATLTVWPAHFMRSNSPAGAVLASCALAAGASIATPRAAPSNDTMSGRAEPPGLSAYLCVLQATWIGSPPVMRDGGRLKPAHLAIGPTVAHGRPERQQSFFPQRPPFLLDTRRPGRDRRARATWRRASQAGR